MTTEKERKTMQFIRASMNVRTRIVIIIMFAAAIITSYVSDTHWVWGILLFMPAQYTLRTFQKCECGEINIVKAKRWDTLLLMLPHYKAKQQILASPANAKDVPLRKICKREGCNRAKEK